MTYEEASNILFQHRHNLADGRPSADLVHQAMQYMEENHGYTCVHSMYDKIACREQCEECRNVDSWQCDV